MFERFTKEARRVMVLTNQEVSQLGHGVILPEHLALGLLALEEETHGGPLRDLGFIPRSLRQELIETAGSLAGPADPDASPPFAPETKKILEVSLREALKMGDNFIGSGHMLLALVKVGGVEPLAGLGRSDPLVQAVRQHHRLKESIPPSRGGARPRLRGFVEVMKSAMSRSTPGTPPGSQHILLTLVARQDTLAGKILAELGVTEERVRELIDTIGTKGTLDEPQDAQVEVRLGNRTVIVSKTALADAVSLLRKKDPKSALDLAVLLEQDDPEPDADA